MLSFFRKLGQVIVRLKGGANAAVSEPFEAICECGATVTGTRRTTWIEAECQSCFQSVFVLPANVYPTTKRVSSSVLSGSFLARLKVVIQEVFPKQERTKPTTETPPSPGTQPAVVTPAKPRFRWPRFDIAGTLRRTFTPFRLLMLAVMAVIGLTGYWMIHERSVEAALQTWIAASDDIDRLLQERKLSSLESVLADAVSAGEVLGKEDSEWRQIRNLLDEIKAANSIASDDLLTAFHNAYDDQIQLVDQAEEKVRYATASGTYVFDSWLRDDPANGNSFLVDLPATPGRHPVEVRIPLPALKELLEGEADRRVLFACSIDRVVGPESRSRDPWKLTVKPESFVLITNSVLSEDLGLPVTEDDELKRLLDRQLEFVTASPAWERRNDTIVSGSGETEQKESTP